MDRVGLQEEQDIEDTMDCSAKNMRPTLKPETF